MPSGAIHGARLPKVEVLSRRSRPGSFERAPRCGERFGRYRIESVLGTGGMATVYLASSGASPTSRRFYALKLLKSELSHDEAHLKMFLAEAKIGSELTHPNVCHVLDYGTVGRRAYLAMELLRGKSLAAIRRSLETIADPAEHALRVARMLADAAEGLEAIHEHRSATEGPLHVVHRDISPDNLILTFDGFLKIIDFGLAKADRRGERTQPGILKGKLSYIAPELLNGGTPDARADIWSLGVVAWELATGRRLFHRTTDSETLKAVLHDHIRPPSEVVPGLPEGFDEVVMTALARDPAARYPSASALGDAVWEFSISARKLVHHRELALWLDALFPGERERTDRRLESAAAESPDCKPAATGPILSRALDPLCDLVRRLRDAAPALLRTPARAALIALLVAASIGSAGFTYARLRHASDELPIPSARALAPPAPVQPPTAPVQRTTLPAGRGFVVEIERPAASGDLVVRVRATPERPLTPRPPTSSTPEAP